MVLFTQESASKEGLFTLEEYGERMMKRQRDARWLDAELEGAEDCRAIVGFPLILSVPSHIPIQAIYPNLNLFWSNSMVKSLAQGEINKSSFLFCPCIAYLPPSSNKRPSDELEKVVEPISKFLTTFI